MKIDIIIPTYNRKKYLEKAINSVLRQSYKNINIIISDNNSTDWTDIFIKEYLNKYNNITYYKQKENIWWLKNYQKCLYEYSKSEYILFLSDDDELYDNTYIEKSIQTFKENTNVVIVMSNTKLFYDDLNLEFDEDKKLKSIINWKEFFLNYWTWDYSISWCNAIFNRKLAIENNCYNWKIFYADSDCFFRLMMFWNIAFIKTIWSIYRLHSKNSYKITSIDKYIKNIDYINRNYDFAKNFLDKDKLNFWKERMITSYFTTVYNNIILFSKNPIYNLNKINKYFSKNNINLKKSYLNLIKLFIARFLMKIKFFHKKMILINNKK